MVEKRKFKTERDIQTTFLNLLQQEPFYKITVAEICEKSLTGRSTFYNHYVDKYDLLEKMVTEYTQMFQDLIHERISQLMSDQGSKVLLDVYQQLVAHKHAILTLFAVHEKEGDLQASFETVLRKEWTNYLATVDQQFSVPRDFMIFLGTDVVMSFIRWSLTNELDENIAVFVDRFRKSMFE
ncbi:TetR family transcriptional regulator [Pediococcus ethanolidurans]|uniref:TetR/AcrR family transcriptional regulator n=1 Tax=Pediococcus ethanolidurans TaxID=319653 RepID=UPI002952C748|nr:TetR/AcrR family transcriptional regulator [Pediococcus ethanolidurans]MDV7718474.1 TetR family transcriptional regulator [Pediococcus ethanolidurans]